MLIFHISQVGVVNKQQQDIENLNQITKGVTKEVEENKAAVARLDLALSDVNSKSGHIEFGQVRCDDHAGGRWSHGTWGTKEVTARFRHPYEKIPAVFTSPRHFETTTDKDLVKFWFLVSKVTTTQVTVACLKDKDGASIPYMWIQWKSFPQ